MECTREERGRHGLEETVPGERGEISNARRGSWTIDNGLFGTKCCAISGSESRDFKSGRNESVWFGGLMRAKNSSTKVPPSVKLVMSG